MHVQEMQTQFPAVATVAHAPGKLSGTMKQQAARVRPLSPSAGGEALLASWRELFDRHARVSSALEAALQTEHGLGLTEFEVLERLAGPEQEQHRMQELAEWAHLSQSALSRLVGRLEAGGLASRSICSEDRRGIYACLTEAGRARYEAARPTHRRVLAEVLGDT